MSNQIQTRAEQQTSLKIAQYEAKLQKHLSLFKELLQNEEANEIYIGIVEKDLQEYNFVILKLKIVLPTLENTEKAFLFVSAEIAQCEYNARKTQSELKLAYKGGEELYAAILEKDVTCYNVAISELKYILNEIDC